MVRHPLLSHPIPSHPIIAHLHLRRVVLRPSHVIPCHNMGAESKGMKVKVRCDEETCDCCDFVTTAVDVRCHGTPPGLIMKSISLITVLDCSTAKARRQKCPCRQWTMVGGVRNIDADLIERERGFRKYFFLFLAPSLLKKNWPVRGVPWYLSCAMSPTVQQYKVFPEANERCGGGGQSFRGIYLVLCHLYGILLRLLL